MNVKIDLSKCNACEQCTIKCAGGAFKAWASYPEFRPENCIDCMACTEPDFCPSNAVEVNQ